MQAKYNFDTKIQARDLYVQHNYSLKSIAKMLKIPNGTISRWSREDEWKEAKREYIKSKKQESQKILDLRKSLLDKAAKDLTSESINALKKVMSLEKEAEKRIEVLETIETNEKEITEIKTPEEALSRLEELLKEKVTKLIENKSINQKDLKDIQGSFKLMDEMKAKYTKNKKQANKDVSQKLFKKILGLQ